MDTILNLTIAQFLMKKKGDTLLVRTSHILVNGDTHCGDASPLYFICKEIIPTDYSLRDSPCTNTQHDL
jgi:hypothetical protein